jgi:hypothetical protein
MRNEKVDISNIFSSANQQLKNEEDIDDFINGCLLLETGGGGGSVIGREMLKDALKNGVRLRCVSTIAWIKCSRSKTFRIWR